MKKLTFSGRLYQYCKISVRLTNFLLESLECGEQLNYTCSMGQLSDSKPSEMEHKKLTMFDASFQHYFVKHFSNIYTKLIGWKYPLPACQL